MHWRSCTLYILIPMVLGRSLLSRILIIIEIEGIKSYVFRTQLLRLVGTAITFQFKIVKLFKTGLKVIAVIQFYYSFSI